MREFNVTFAWVRPNRRTGTTVMMQVALVARIKLPSNMVAPWIEPAFIGLKPKTLITTELRPQVSVGELERIQP